MCMKGGGMKDEGSEKREKNKCQEANRLAFGQAGQLNGGRRV